MKTNILTKVFAITFIAIISCAPQLRAQDKAISLGLEVALPMGDDADFYSLAIGGSGRIELPVGDAMGFTGTVGYLSYLLKGDAEGISLSMVPIQVGLKYYFTDQMEGFYGMAEVGIHITTATVEFLGTSVSASSSNLSYAPGIGMYLGKLDLGVRYQLQSTDAGSSSYLGLRIAYTLSGGK